jgi:hypothetical protein
MKRVVARSSIGSFGLFRARSRPGGTESSGWSSLPVRALLVNATVFWAPVFAGNLSQ